MADLEKLAEELGKLTVMEAAELTKMLEEKWGVTAAAPMSMAAMPAGVGAAVEAVEEKTEFDVILKDVGPKKIDVIKVIRQITTLGLKDAKDLAETVNAKVLEQSGKEASQDAKSKLEAAGATVELV
ncbi:MAG TPA: 50S ribosomal protein L7/L12 [Anaerolineales bacterium]|jgi:large subunit ribosomal protein L7/L12|nr:50S ribosomal protein L7/L12 [Anaerolineales bacterium]